MIIRTYVFYFFFILTWIFCFVLGSPLLLLPSRFALKTCQVFGQIILFWVRIIGGIKTEIRGLEKLPQGNYILACKHQSEWETFVLGAIIDWPVFLIKKELLRVPFFGWFMARSNMVAVDRKAGSGVMRQMLKQALPALEQNMTLIVFPEGTRIMPGTRSKYKSGVAALYTKADVPVLPVALNSGVFWYKGKLLRQGTAVMEILDMIPVGLSSEEFMARLETTIEDASQKLYEEAMEKSN
jgi:1-acyl-sn-glycerol-3-phosphate acyltransferase